MTSGAMHVKGQVCGVPHPVFLAILVMVFLCAGCATAADTDGLPVLLVYGFQPVPGFYAPFLWEELAEALSGRSLGEIEKVVIKPGHQVYRLRAVDLEHRDVVIGDYTMAFEPTVRDLRFYAERVADEIAWVTGVHDVSQVDLVAHSMGGLVARCYVESSDFEEELGRSGFDDFGTEYRGDVRLLITLATPHHGADFAAWGPWYGTLSRQLPPGSRLLELLNRVEADGLALNPAVRYVTMAGQSCLGCGLRRDEAGCLRACAEEGEVWNGSDLVVRMASAWLNEGENVACIGFNHTEMRAHSGVLDVVFAALSSQPLPDVIYRYEAMRPESHGGGEPSDSSSQTE